MNTNPSKTSQLWSRLAEMYGADVISKRFGDTPPQSWSEVIEAMPDYKLQRGMRRLIYKGGEFPPTLPAFTKLCEDIGGAGEYDEGPRPFLPKPHERKWGVWEIEANNHLLAYCIDKIHKRDTRFLNERCLPRLIAAKNAWAQDMESEAIEGYMPIGRQQETWREVIAYAESDLSAMLASSADERRVAAQ